MDGLFVVAAAPFLVLGLMLLYPEAYAVLVADLKRLWRLYLVRRYGQKAYQDLATTFRALVSGEGYDKQIIEEILRDAKTGAIDRLGKKEANARLGEPSPLERYH